MKKLPILLLSAIALLASCEKVDESLVGKPQDIIANLEETRTTSSGNKTSWAQGDQMSVFYTKSTGVYGVSCYTYSAGNRFSGNVSSLGTGSNNWFAFYPFNKNNTEVEDIILQVPEKQTQEGNSNTKHISGDLDPLYGYARNVAYGNDPKISMHHALTKVKFHISNAESKPVTVTKIEFKSPRDIAGSFKADISASSIVWGTYKSTRSVTLNVENGEAIDPDYSADFSTNILPISAQGTFTVTVYATIDDKEVVSSKSLNAQMDLVAGYTNTLNFEFKTSGSDNPDTPDTPDDPTKQDQVLSFGSDEVFWTLGSGYEIGNSYSPQSVNGASTAITWTSSNENVATINNGMISIKAAGATTITANAAANDSYNAASASYVLYIENADQPQTTAAYVKVTSEPSNWDGTYIVVDENSGKAFAPFTGNASSYAVSVTISNGQILSDGVIDKYAITVTNAGKNHENDNVSGLRAYNVQNSDGQYIWWSSNFGEYDSARLVTNSTNTAENSSTTYEYYHTFKYDGGVQMASAIQTSGGNAYYLGYSSSSFAYSSSSSSNRVSLYKLSEGTTPGGTTPQSISFAKSSVNWTLGNGCEIGGTYGVQALSGTYYTTVSYTSSNTSVASIVNGNIQVNGTGSTTITATAAASSSYSSASASYTLTISNNGGGSTTSGYQLLTSAPSDWSGSYLIVSADKAYLFNGETGGRSGSSSSSNRVSLSSSDFSGNTITNSSLSQYAFTITKSGSDYYIKKGSNYYYCDYDSNSSTGIVTSTSQSKAAWSFEGVTSSNGFQFYQVESSKNQYIYYKDSDNTFKFGNSGKGVGVLLYKSSSTVPGGDTPDQPDQPDQPGQSGDYFVKVTSAPSSWDGTYLVVDESAKKAFAYNASSSYATSVTISSGRIAWTSDLDKIAVRVSDAGKNHPNTQLASDLGGGTLRAYDVKTNEGKYIYASQSEVKVGDDNTKSTSGGSGWSYGGGGGSTTNHYYHVFSYSGGDVYMVSSADYDSSSSSQEYYYSLSYSSSKFAYNQGKSKLAKVQLYKLNGTSGGNTPDTPGTPDTPTPSGTSFNLENSTLTQYLDDAASSYTNSNYSTTVVEKYTGRNATLDLPNPVSLSWSGNATSISIYEGTSTSGTAFKTQSFTSSSSVDVYNLIPGKTYTYKTSNGQTGTFNTTGRRRMIKVSSSANTDHARNCRDFGGIVTAKGEKLKYGLIFRGTNMDKVTTDEKAILRDELGIKLDVDLRGESKTSPLGSDIALSNQAYQSGQLDNSSNDSKIAITVGDILNSVIDNKPVYIHCYIGSDRTGYICMLLQALLGVSKKECDIDYEITSFAGAIVMGTRPKEYTDNKDFRVKFCSNADQAPKAVEDYVVNTLKISLDTVKKFRKAMGVSETL